MIENLPGGRIRVVHDGFAAHVCYDPSQADDHPDRVEGWEAGVVPGQADGNGDNLLAHSDDGEGQTRTDSDGQVLKHLKTTKVRII